MILPFQSRAPTGLVGNVLMQGPLAGTQVASFQSIDMACGLFGVGSGRSLRLGVCHSPLRHLRSWLLLGTLYSCRAECCKSMFSLNSIGKIVSN